MRNLPVDALKVQGVERGVRVFDSMQSNDNSTGRESMSTRIGGVDSSGGSERKFDTIFDADPVPAWAEGMKLKGVLYSILAAKAQELGWTCLPTQGRCTDEFVLVDPVH